MPQSSDEDFEEYPYDDDRFNTGVAENAGETAGKVVETAVADAVAQVENAVVAAEAAEEAADAIEDVEELEFIKEWISKRDRRWTWK